MASAAAAAEAVRIEPLALESVRSLTATHPAPCLSLYQPTHRNVPDNTVDRPAFRHLVEALEEALAETHPRHEIEALLRPFHLLADDPHFWAHTHEGLAVLAAAGQAHVFRLPRAVAPLAMVTDRFHTLPLVRQVAALERFHVLALTSRTARVYEGLDVGAGAVPCRVEAVPLTETGVVISRDDAISAEIVEPHRVKHGMGPSGAADTRYAHGGFRSKQDDLDADTEIFFRSVDELVHERISKPTGLPLVLVALPEHAAVLYGLSKNRLLLDEHVSRDPQRLKPDEMAALVAPIFAAARRRRIAHAVRLFEQARDRGLAAGDLADVARAAVAGKVATLLIEADRFEAGTFDRCTGGIEFGGDRLPDLSRTGDTPAVVREDLFGAVAEEVLLHGGGILTLDRNAMPTATGVAAIYRYR